MCLPVKGGVWWPDSSSSRRPDPPVCHCRAGRRIAPASGTDAANGQHRTGQPDPARCTPAKPLLLKDNRRQPPRRCPDARGRWQRIESMTAGDCARTAARNRRAMRLPRLIHLSIAAGLPLPPLRRQRLPGGASARSSRTAHAGPARPVTVGPNGVRLHGGIRRRSRPPAPPASGHLACGAGPGDPSDREKYAGYLAGRYSSGSTGLPL